MKELWSVVFCILTFYKTTLAVNLSVATILKTAIKISANKRVSQAAGMKISLISTSKISATWPGKLQYLHENEKVKFVL